MPLSQRLSSIGRTPELPSGSHCLTRGLMKSSARVRRKRSAVYARECLERGNTVSKEWLSAHSFERLHRLISAINTISIHTKLEMAGMDDSSRVSGAEEARNDLLNFLEGLEPILSNVERDPDRVAIGVDPRLGALARGFVDIRRHRPRVSALASISLTQLRQLLTSDDPKVRGRLITCLRDLRRLLEQHAHADIISILGEL